MKTDNNTILITGGATGIGYALAEQFINLGNEVIICGRRENKLMEARERLPEIHIKVCDVNIKTEREKLISWTIEYFPNFNIFINNAGIQKLLFLLRENSSDDIANEVFTNLIAPIHFSNLVVNHFSSKNEAAIINITSGLGFIPLAVTPVYCATKAALHSFSISSRHQLKNTSIRVFEIAPPIVETELGSDGNREGRKIQGIQPSEVAKETIDAISSENYELPIGQAKNLFIAAHSDGSKIAFEGMNR